VHRGCVGSQETWREELVMGEQKRVVLPEVTLRAVRSIGRDESLTPTERMESMVVVAFGGIWWASKESIDGRDWAIPEAQWREVAELLVGLTPASEVGRVNYGLTWMNIGPSAYAEEPV
jgi:hypothetical protein